MITRSMLFAPGDKPAMLRKSLQAGADAVIWDLEDAVAPSAKGDARLALGDALQSLPTQHVPIVVRINALPANMLDDDLAPIVRSDLHAVLLPKAERAEDIRHLDQALDRLERGAGLPDRAIQIHCLIETCAGVVNACSIATASPRIQALCFGAEDFTLDLGVARTREGLELAHARGAVALAAGAARLVAVDTVYADLADTQGLVHECRLARQVGFRGKLAIHPKQVEIINREFEPSEAEVAYARRVVAAFAEAEERQLGVTMLDGRMIDAPIVARAKLILRSVKTPVDADVRVDRR